MIAKFMLPISIIMLISSAGASCSEDLPDLVDKILPSMVVIYAYNDSGDYCIGNCRFVDYRVNYAEKKITDKIRTTSRKNIKAFKDSQSFHDRSIIAKKIVETKRKNGTPFFAVDNSLTRQQIQDRIDHINKSDKSRGWVCRVA